MGGVFNINLYLHRKDDKQYNKKRRELRKYVPILQAYLSQMVLKGRSTELSYTILSEFLKQVNNSSRRVPIHVLLRGEDLLRREVLNFHEAKSSIVEVVWRSQGFRLAVQKKLEDTINQYGNDTGRSHEAMEKRIFDKAKTKEEYLENAAKIIIYLREMNFRENMVTDPWKEVHAAKKAASAYVEHELSMHLHHNKPLQCTTTTHMNDETDHVLSSLARGQKPDLKQLMARMTWRRRIPQPISGHGWSSTITKTKPSATITSARESNLQMVIKLQVGHHHGHKRLSSGSEPLKRPGGKLNPKVLPEPPAKMPRLSPTELIEFKPLEVDVDLPGPRSPQTAPRAFLHGYSTLALVEMWTIAAQNTPVTQGQLDKIAKGAPKGVTGDLKKETAQLLLSLRDTKAAQLSVAESFGTSGVSPPSSDLEPCCSKSLPPVAHQQQKSLLRPKEPKEMRPEFKISESPAKQLSPASVDDSLSKVLDLRQCGRKGKGRGKCSDKSRKGPLTPPEDLCEQKKRLALAQRVSPLYGRIPVNGGMTDPNEFVVRNRASTVMKTDTTKLRETTVPSVVGASKLYITRRRTHYHDQPKPPSRFKQSIMNEALSKKYTSSSSDAVRSELDGGTKKMLQNVLHSRTRSPFREGNINSILELGNPKKESLGSETLTQKPQVGVCGHRYAPYQKRPYEQLLNPKVEDLSPIRERETLPMCSSATTSVSGKGLPVHLGASAPLTPPDSPPDSLFKA